MSSDKSESFDEDLIKEMKAMMEKSFHSDDDDNDGETKSDKSDKKNTNISPNKHEDNDQNDNKMNKNNNQKINNNSNNNKNNNNNNNRDFTPERRNTATSSMILDEDIDFHKIKNNKLFKKFLKEQQKTNNKQNKPDKNVKEDKDIKQDKDTKQDKNVKYAKHQQKDEKLDTSNSTSNNFLSDKFQGNAFTTFSNFNAFNSNKDANNQMNMTLPKPSTKFDINEILNKPLSSTTTPILSKAFEPTIGNFGLSISQQGNTPKTDFYTSRLTDDNKFPQFGLSKDIFSGKDLFGSKDTFIPKESFGFSTKDIFAGKDSFTPKGSSYTPKDIFGNKDSFSGALMFGGKDSFTGLAGFGTKDAFPSKDPFPPRVYTPPIRNSAAEFNPAEELQGYSEIVPGSPMKSRANMDLGTFQRSKYEMPSDSNLLGSLNAVTPANFMSSYSQQPQMKFGSTSSFLPNNNNNNAAQSSFPYSSNLEVMQSPKYPTNDPNDNFLLQSKINELTQNLSREQEANKKLDSKCSEYITQLEKLSNSFEEFKNKTFDQNSNYQAEIDMLQEKVRDLTEKLNSIEREESQDRDEIANLRRKFQNESTSRNKLLEENDELKRKLDEITKTNREKEDFMDRNREDLIRMRKQSELDRAEASSLRDKNEKLLVEIKEFESYNREVQDKLKDLQKTLEDRTQRFNLSNIENENLRDQINTMQNQYKKLLTENDNLKSQVFEQRQALLDYEKKNLNLSMLLEKSEMELVQTKTLLSKTERNLENEKNINADLLRELNNDQRIITDLSIQVKSFKQNQKNNNENEYSSSNNTKKLKSSSLIQETADYGNITNKRDDYNNTEKSSKKRNIYNNNDQDESLSQTKYHSMYNSNIRERNNQYQQQQQDKQQYQNNDFNKTAKSPQLKANNILAWEEPEQNLNYSKYKTINKNNTNNRQDYNSRNEFNQTSDISSSYRHNEKRSSTNEQDKITNHMNRHQNNSVGVPSEKAKNLETHLMNLQIERDTLQNELGKIEKQKLKSGASIKRKQEIENDLGLLQNNISLVKTKLREMNALHH